MGMYAEILCVGPYAEELVDYYEYPAGHYAEMNEGLPVVRTLFGIIEGSSAGRDFAAYLGIDDPWDFRQHKIDAGRIDIAGLEQFFSTLGDGEEYRAQLPALAAFMAHNYDLYFLPNG